MIRTVGLTRRAVLPCPRYPSRNRNPDGAAGVPPVRVRRMPELLRRGAWKRSGKALAVSAAATVAASRSGFACTAALLSHGGDVVVVKSYDDYMGQGHVVVNRRGLAKTSMVVGGEKAASPSWPATGGRRALRSSTWTGSSSFTWVPGCPSAR